MKRRLLASVAIGTFVFHSPPSLAQGGAPADAEQSAGAPREGLFTVAHFGADLGAYRRAVEARGAELAGVTHRFTSDAAEFASITGASVPAPEAGRVTVVVVDSMGRSLGTATVTAADARAFDAVAKAVASETRWRSIEDYNLPKNSSLAIEGYDPVAYFTEGKAQKGSKDTVSTYRGVQYRFASPGNRDLFNQNPAAYLPTYGGWCASAMGAKGTKVEIDPRSFKIKDGRLHLFYKDFFSDALKDWNMNEREWEPAADRNWERLTGERARTAGAGSDRR